VAIKQKFPSNHRYNDSHFVSPYLESGLTLLPKYELHIATNYTVMAHFSCIPYPTV